MSGADASQLRRPWLLHRSFDGRTSRDSAGRTVHQNIGGPIFRSNILDLVVASLPLREGLTVELPFFI
jgi:hypothetical protein